jgi:hemerythrin superfamily protein
LKTNKIVWNRTVKLIEKDRKSAMKKVMEDIAKMEAE